MNTPVNVGILLTWALLSTASVPQQPATATAQQSTTGAATVSLIGCVERLPSAQGTPANAPPAYKLIDVQPGAATRMTVRIDAQFLLDASKSPATPIELGKFQNQRVEVTGTIAPAPTAAVGAETKPGAAVAAPLPTFTVTSLKVVSTECK